MSNQHEADLLLAQANAIMTAASSSGKLNREHYGAWLSRYLDFCGGKPAAAIPPVVNSDHDQSKWPT